MGHRQLYFPSQTSDMWNHPYPDPHFRIDTATTGVHPVPYFDITLRSNDLPSSSFSLEIPNHHMRANPGLLHSPFMHPASSSSSNLMPPNYFPGGPPCYDAFAINSHMDYERAPFKRKTPALSMAFDRGNGNSHHSVGISNSISISSVNSQANPTPHPQYWAWDPTSMPPSYRNNNLSTVSEGSQRNVRSRQSLPFHLGNRQTAAHPPGNLPHHLHPSSNIPGVVAAGHWGHAPALGYPRRIPPAGTGSFNHGMAQSLAVSNNTNMAVEGGNPCNPLHDRILSAPLQTSNSLSSQAVSVGRSSYDQRTHSNRAVSSHQPVGFGTPLANERRQVIEALPPPRYSRSLPFIPRSSERNGRSRGLYDRFQPFSYGNSVHGGWVSEGRTIYDSRNLFDQHHNMRLNIDNMSYEELLDLEERIGNVSTGLSGDIISRHLMEITYCLPNQIQDYQEEENCVICLEVYQDKENVGRLNCGHDFHSSCIRKWLTIKNMCPICKASALPDTSEER